MPDADVDRAPSQAVSLGCVFRPENPPEHLAAAARAAERAGVAELWLWEDCFFHGGVSAAAIALAAGSGLVVGVGVLPAPLRNVAVTAMEIATLDRAFPGRLRIGVGHGVQEWMGQVGARVASPLTLLREYTIALSALLRGESVTCSGRYVSLSDVRLDWPPTTDVELLLAATGPKTLALSGELAAGTVLTSGTSPEALRDSVSSIRGGVGPLRSFRHQVVVYVECAANGDVHPARLADDARAFVAAGADTVVFQPPPGADPVAFIDLVGSRVRPLLA